MVIMAVTMLFLAPAVVTQAAEGDELDFSETLLTIGKGQSKIITVTDKNSRAISGIYTTNAKSSVLAQEYLRALTDIIRLLCILVLMRLLQEFRSGSILMIVIIMIMWMYVSLEIQLLQQVHMPHFSIHQQQPLRVQHPAQLLISIQTSGSALTRA